MKQFKFWFYWGISNPLTTGEESIYIFSGLSNHCWKNLTPTPSLFKLSLTRKHPALHATATQNPDRQAQTHVHKHQSHHPLLSYCLDTPHHHKCVWHDEFISHSSCRYFGPVRHCCEGTLPSEFITQTISLLHHLVYKSKQAWIISSRVRQSKKHLLVTKRFTPPPPHTSPQGHNHKLVCLTDATFCVWNGRKLQSKFTAEAQGNYSKAQIQSNVFFIEDLGKGEQLSALKLWDHVSGVVLVTTKIGSIENMNAWFLSQGAAVMWCTAVLWNFVATQWSGTCHCSTEYSQFLCAWILPSLLPYPLHGIAP